VTLQQKEIAVLERQKRTDKEVVEILIKSGKVDPSILN